MLTRSFPAMGTEVELFLDADERSAGLLAEAEAEFLRFEALFSRFRPDSELSLLNAERTRQVGPELLELVQLALGARERTEGRFDPTVHDALVAWGYDRTFELVDASVVPDATPAPCAGDVEVDLSESRISLGAGASLDLGGIAKGWAADRALGRLAPAGPALVNAGGDVSCSDGVWHVGVETPAGHLTLELTHGGLATSGRDRRRWQQGDREAHHLIDPATGAPAAGDILTATAVAPTATQAEVEAKSLFLAGDVARAAAEADESGVPAVLVTRSGDVRLAGGLG